MTIAQLFLNIAEYNQLPLDFSENLESLYSLDFTDSGLVIKDILNKRYPDGIAGLEDVEVVGSSITGIFLDQISPSVTKKFNFTIDSDSGAVVYDQIDTGDLDFSEVDFATKKSQSCTEGKSSGCTREDGTVYCIPIGRKCATGKKLDAVETKAVKAIVEKAPKATKIKAVKEKVVKPKATKVANPKVNPEQENIRISNLPNVDDTFIKNYQNEIEADPFFGSTAKYYIVSAKKTIRGDKALKASKMSPVELAMVTHYTDASSGDYPLINALLRENDTKVNAIIKNKVGLGDNRDIKSFKERANKQAALLNNALDKLPAYIGDVVRKSPLSQATIDQYQVGDTIQEKGFTSTTTSDDYGINVPPNRVEAIFKIKSKFGREISSYSAFPDEEEVLFKSGTQFKVLKKKRLKTEKCLSLWRKFNV